MGTRSLAAVAAAGLLVSGLAFGAVRATGHTESARWEETTADAPTGKPADSQLSGVAATTRKAPGRSPVPGPEGLQELRKAAAKAPVVRLDAQGALRTITAQPGTTLKPPLAQSAGTKPSAVAEAFASRYGPTFGLPANQTLKRLSSGTVPGGDQVVRFNQYAGGLPVLGGQVLVTVDKSGGVRAASGETARTAPAATTAKVGAATARGTAVKAAARQLALDKSTLTAGPAALWLFDPRLIGASGRPQLRPTWRINVYAGPVRAGDGEAEVLVDAVDGSVTLVVSAHRDALYRLVCDLANRAVNLNDRSQYKCDEASGGPAITRREGGAATSLADVNQAYDQMGTAYNFYKSTFGRDSFDNAGAPIAATVRACDPSFLCPYQNAFWEGTQFVFGQGFAVADDVVTHEFTHAVTEHTSNLFYWQQSGAINEALSDIMGQLLDLRTPGDDAGTLRWRLGEALSVGAIRDMQNPPAFGQPDRYKSTLWDPDASNLDNGGVHTNSGVANKAASLIADGGTFNGQTLTAIGLAKSEQLWYRVMNQLSSGANYADLGATLSSACRQLVGYRGFTVNDCAQVDKAVTATEMPLAADPTDAHSAQAAVCPSAGQPTQDLFFDDFERATARWSTSSSYFWQRIPSATIPYSYAHSGAGSFNGWTAPGLTGNGATAAIAKNLTIPGGSTYLWFAHSMLDNNGGAGVVQVDDGSGWKPLTTTATGIPPTSGRFTRVTAGYGSTRFDLSSYAGKALKVRFLVDSPSNALVDWYIDDVRVYQCSNSPGVPRNLTGVRNAAADQATLDWDVPQFTGTGVASYEVSINPAPASGSRTFTTTDTAYTLTGLNPTTVYNVAVRAKGVDGSFGVSVTLALRLTPPPANCTEETGPINPYTGRPMPACRPVPVLGR